MNLVRKYWLPVSIYLFAFFIIPVLARGYVDDGFGLIIINILLGNSAAVFFGVCYITYKYGLDWLNIVIITILYLVSCFVVWNSSAIGYLILYGIIAAIALLTGYLFRKSL